MIRDTFQILHVFVVFDRRYSDDVSPNSYLSDLDNAF